MSDQGGIGIGDIINSTRGFLADPLARFTQNRQKQQAQSSGPGGLGDYIGQTFDPLARLQQTQFGPGGSWGTTTGALPALDWLERNPFAKPKPKESPKPGGGVYEGSGATPGLGGSGGSWTGPATGADNATLTADKVEQVIVQTRANSPLRGKGAWLLAEANKRNISLPLFMGIMLAESELGTTAGPGWGALVGLGGAGNLRQYGSLEEAALAGMDNLASDQYQPLSLEAKIGYWFPGPQNWAAHGLDASDGHNGTVRDYISGKVAPMYAAFGVPFQQAAAPTRQAAPSGSGGGAAGPLFSAGSALVGTPYVLGGLRQHPNNPELGLDCSELTAYLWGKQGVTLPWNAQQQYNQTQRVTGDQLQTGDLIFFHGTNPADPDYVTHVGIYWGNGMMLNAQDGGVMMAALNSPYWQEHLAGYGRVQAGQNTGPGSAPRPAPAPAPR